MNGKQVQLRLPEEVNRAVEVLVARGEYLHKGDAVREAVRHWGPVRRVLEEQKERGDTGEA